MEQTAVLCFNMDEFLTKFVPETVAHDSIRSFKVIGRVLHTNKGNFVAITNNVRDVRGYNFTKIIRYGRYYEIQNLDEIESDLSYRMV